MQKKQYKVGYLPMTADLFHVGHLAVIKKARSSCEFLIVGLLTDKAIKQYMGKLPTIPFIERKMILEAIKVIDKVVKQDALYMYDNLKKWKVSAVFTADGWETKELKAMEKAGCEPVDFSFKYRNQSTTRIKKRILFFK